MSSYLATRERDDGQEAVRTLQEQLVPEWLPAVAMMLLSLHDELRTNRTS